MFKHKEKVIVEPEAKEPPPSAKTEASEAPALRAPATLDDVRALLEKNLKWSQIIYEQNRKLNRKLIWSAVASWLPFIIIMVPIVFGLIYLPSIISNLQASYGQLFNQSKAGLPTNTSLKNVLDLLPINSVEREQLKAMIK